MNTTMHARIVLLLVTLFPVSAFAGWNLQVISADFYEIKLSITGGPPDKHDPSGLNSPPIHPNALTIEGLADFPACGGVSNAGTKITGNPMAGHTQIGINGAEGGGIVLHFEESLEAASGGGVITLSGYKKGIPKFNRFATYRLSLYWGTDSDTRRVLQSRVELVPVAPRIVMHSCNNQLVAVYPGKYDVETSASLTDWSDYRYAQWGIFRIDLTKSRDKSRYFRLVER